MSPVAQFLAAWWQETALVGLVLLVLFLGRHIGGLRDDLAAQDAEHRAEVATLVAEAERAGREALEAAQAAHRARVAELEAQAAQSLAQARAAAWQASQSAAAWRERYRAALESSPDCATWAEAPIQCPVE